MLKKNNTFLEIIRKGLRACTALTEDWSLFFRIRNEQLIATCNSNSRRLMSLLDSYVHILKPHTRTHTHIVKINQRCG